MSGIGTIRRIGDHSTMIKILRQQIKSTFLGILIGLLIPSLALATDATLLPNAKQQYLDDAGNPVASGSVGYYIPTTLTKKTVWQDAGKTTPQTNPVLLDAAGRPQPDGQTFGDGIYRQQVKDANGIVIWDAITTSTGGGSTPTPPVTTGDGNTVGTVLPWVGMVAPPSYVFAYGQPISRASFPLYYSTVITPLNAVCTIGLNLVTGLSDTQNIRVGSPVEASCIPPGSTVTAVFSNSVSISSVASVSAAVIATFFPYGNGDGSSTFNVPDLRGYVIAGRNNMGGVASTGLTSQYFGTNPNGQNSAGGNQFTQIGLLNLPPYTPAGTILSILSAATASTPVASLDNVGGTTDVNFISLKNNGNTNAGAFSSPVTGTVTSTFTGAAQGGTSNPISVIQPTKTLSYIVKISPDASGSSVSGVASINGMTGVLACGAGINCSSQTISLTGNFGIIKVDSIAALKVLPDPTFYGGIEVLGYYTPGDKGGGDFYWDASSVVADNGGTVIQSSAVVGAGRWIRLTGGQPLSVRWFGAKGDGVANDTAAIGNTLIAGANAAVYVPAASVHYLINSALPTVSNTTVDGDGPASLIRSSNLNASILTCTTQSGITLKNLAFAYTGASAAHLVAAISFVNCDNSHIYNNEISSYLQHGIMLFNSSNNTMTNNYIHGHIGTDDGSADIGVYDNSSYNTISNNLLYGGATAWFGVIIQDFNGGFTPLKNQVLNNIIKTHSAYGIVNYNQPSNTVNDYTLIDGNTVEEITGDANILNLGQKQSGMCIYSVQNGGAQIVNNKVNNCNQVTVSENLAPAAIAVSQDNLALTPNIIANNQIITSHKKGIQISGTEAIITGNTVEISGSATGGIAGLGANNINVSNNTVRITGALAVPSMIVEALTLGGVSGSTNVNVSDNIVNGGNAEGLLIFNGGVGLTITGTVSGNQFNSSQASFVAMSIQDMSGCSIANNTVTNSNIALTLINSSNCRGSGNVLKGTLYGFSTGGTNSGNVFDTSNYFGTTAKMNNTVAGTTWYVNVATIPTTGTWQIGDRADTTAPVLGATKGWINTTAGSPGTWTQNSATTVNGTVCTIGNTCTITASTSVGSITGLGTGIATALAINVGSAGAPVLFNSALGTPSSGTLGSGVSIDLSTVSLAGSLPCARMPALSGVITTSAGSCTTALGSFSSAGLLGALTDETGSGVAVFGTSPILSTVDARGTWTTGTSWTLPAHTWGGAITGGAFAVNNTGRLGVGYTTSASGLFSRSYDMEAGVNAAGNAGFEINASTGNSANLDMGVNAARTFAISTNASGTQISQFGSVPMSFAINGGASNALSMLSDGSTVLGSGAIVTTATGGFLYVVTSAGQPTGVPVAQTGRVPLIYDTTNNQFWIYNGGWKQPKTPAGAALVTWQ